MPMILGLGDGTDNDGARFQWVVVVGWSWSCCVLAAMNWVLGFGLENLGFKMSWRNRLCVLI